MILLLSGLSNNCAILLLEHPSGFNQFLTAIKSLGTGAMELHAMHLKSNGALCARQLSYEACEFELVEGVGDERIRRVYNKGMT